MTYTITIKDEQGLHVLPNATLTFSSPTGGVLASFVTGASGSVQLSSEFDGPLFQSGNTLLITAPGFHSSSITVDSLQPDNEFWLIANPIHQWVKPVLVGLGALGLTLWIFKKS